MYEDRLRKEDWEIKVMSVRDATPFVVNFHYAKGASNTATYLHGLFNKLDNKCYGVAWWIPPTKSAALATYPENWKGVMCLSRLVIVPDVPKNAATFLLSQSRKLIDRKLWPCLVTYADSWQGHRGTIYKADNWDYVGETKPQPMYVLNGRMISRKAGPKTRTHAEMLEMGCEFLGKYPKHKYVRVGR